MIEETLVRDQISNTCKPREIIFAIRLFQVIVEAPVKELTSSEDIIKVKEGEKK